jgi:hypothetical protein
MFSIVTRIPLPERDYLRHLASNLTKSENSIIGHQKSNCRLPFARHCRISEVYVTQCISVKKVTIIKDYSRKKCIVYSKRLNQVLHQLRYNVRFIKKMYLFKVKEIVVRYHQT